MTTEQFNLKKCLGTIQFKKCGASTFLFPEHTPRESQRWQ